jgi:hypothetical protein
MSNHYEYALANPDENDAIIGNNNWTKDYPLIRSASRTATKAGVPNKILMKEVATVEMYNNEPAYNLNSLVEDIAPVLTALKYLPADTDVNSSKEQFDAVERLALLLMPIFGESIAISLVKSAQENYADEEGDDFETCARNDVKRDKYYDQAGNIRRISGVGSWSKSAGSGLSTDDLS